MKTNTNILKIPINRILALLIMDIIVILVASFGAVFIRFEFSFSQIPKHYLDQYARILPFTIIITLFFFWLWNLYKSVWRYASATELVNIAFATVCAALSQWLVSHWVLKEKMPRSYYVLYWFFLFAMTCAVRFSYRILRIINNKRMNIFSRNTGNNVMVIGAGAAADMILKEIESSKYINLQVRCIIDDQPGCHGKLLRGVPIIGGREKILDAVAAYGIDEIIFAIPSAKRAVRKEILDICKESGCKLRTIPGTYQLINGDVSVSTLREVEIEDLLGREPIHINTDEILDYVSGKVVMVTGGGGSIGSELCRQIASHRPGQLIILDIYENNAYEIEQELRRKYPRLNLVVLIASVRNRKRIDRIFEVYRPEVIYHAAAHKHVPLMEDSPNEAVKNNVLGTWNVVQAADRFKAGRFVLISTDKAVNPTNVMGATKRICEMIIQTYNNRSETEFVAVRFGNVLGSNGSVIPLFKKQIAEGGPVTVTDPEIVRYFMTIPEAVSLVLQAGAYAKGGEIFVLDMGEPVKIVDLAENLIKLSGYRVGEEIEIRFTGLRPGEKMYEERLMKEEGLQQTANKMISIGKALQIDEEQFLKQLKELNDYVQQEPEDIRSFLQQMVPTYVPGKEFEQD